MIKKLFTILLALSFVLTAQAKKARKYSLGGKKLPSLNSTAHVLITLNNGEVEGSCSGSLISPTHVLTAAHCIASPEGGQQFDASDFKVKIAGVDYDVIATAVNANYDPNAVVNEQSSQYDIGILTLEEAVTNLVPLSIANDLSIGVGDIAYFYGYGTNEKPLLNANAEAVNRGAVGKIKIIEITDGAFNAIRRKKKLFATTCPGDSGGAVMSSLGQDAVIIGTISAGTTGQKINGACKSTTRFDSDIFVNIQSASSQAFINSVIGE